MSPKNLSPMKEIPEFHADTPSSIGDDLATLNMLIIDLLTEPELLSGRVELMDLLELVEEIQKKFGFDQSCNEEEWLEDSLPEPIRTSRMDAGTQPTD